MSVIVADGCHSAAQMWADSPALPEPVVTMVTSRLSCDVVRAEGRLVHLTRSERLAQAFRLSLVSKAV